MLLLSRARILEPHLRHTFAEAGAHRNALQILSVRIVVDFEAAVQHLQLLLRERGAHPFALLLRAADAVVAGARLDLHRFHVVLATEDLLAEHGELLAGGQLPVARVAREARQVIDGVLGLAHPIAGTDFTAALCTSGYA